MKIYEIKKLLVILLVVLIRNGYSQPTINFDKEGFYQEVVDLDSENAYKKTLDWIGRYYNTPDKVIKSKIEDEYIRIEGILEQSKGTPAIKHSIEFDFKPNKYRVNIKIIKLSVDSKIMSGWGYSIYFKRDGTVKKVEAKKKAHVDIKVQELLDSHFKYIIADKEDSDW